MRRLFRGLSVAGFGLLAALSINAPSHSPAFAQDDSSVEPLDPFTVAIELDDALRFADLFRETGGAPDAAQLKSGYLDRGDRALEVFTPGRIVDAGNLAANIAADPAAYADAVERCLPMVRQSESDLRAIYFAFRGLLPERELPRIAVVFGAGNSGGTARPGMQVLGLEVLCRASPDEAAFRALLRDFFAHETVHTMQRLDRAKLERDGLLAATIMEGTADYIAHLVTGSVPDPARAKWARENEELVWREFAADIRIWRDPAIGMGRKMQAYTRWIGNAGNPPDGWPSELGYWVGMRIAEGYVANAPDRQAAIRELLEFDNPSAVLAQSGLELPAI